MEEERKLPKNIRQVAEKEDCVRVYVEDYVYTFIHKLDCTQGARTGILLGKRMVAEEKRCWFVQGAVELDAEYEGTDMDFQGKIWDKTQEVIQKYFTEFSVCGWFICAAEEKFPDKEQLKKTHQQIFAGENCLMYWKEGAEDSFWMEEDSDMFHLRGYYVYYEKNQEMQDYMLNRKEEASEDVSDQAAINFRKIMKEKQEIRTDLKRQTQMGLQLKAGIAAAVIIMTAGAIFLSERLADKKENSVHALAVGASVEVQTKEDETNSEIKSENQTKSMEESNERENRAALEEQTNIDGNNQQKDNIQDNKYNAEEKSKGTEIEDIEKEDDEKTQNYADVKNTYEVKTQESGKIFSGDMMFYQDGLGASVYRITKNETAKTDAASPKKSQDKVNEGIQESTQEILNIEIPTLENSETDEKLQQASVNRPASYTVQPGDTLIKISRQFYGSSGMVMQIKEANALDDINKIYIGQELKLP